MTKNKVWKAECLQGTPGQTIALSNDNGDIIGYTYPKRAKGLIRKGRAVPVSDCVIRLKDCPAHTCAEVSMMDANYIFFKPREWTIFQAERGNARYDRFFGDNPIGDGLVEMVTMSNFGNWYTRIGKRVHLEKDTTYHFVFWLNGGENDAETEVCNLVLLYLDDLNAEVTEKEWGERCTYKLNRSYIKPVKRYRGWELYDIAFETGEQEDMLICFEADKAPMALMQADSVESYSGLEDEEDEFAAKRPQRHNMVFSDGWPTNTWFSTDTFREEWRFR